MTYHRRKKQMRDRFQVFEENDSDRKVILLRNKAEIRSYLVHIKS